jgi:predicted amidohydrolase
VRAAAVQLTATADKATNLETADRLVRAAARDGARLVVLPEKWSVYGTPEDQRAGAEPVADGPALQWARAIARELELDLVAGSIAEQADGGDPRGRGHNTCVHVGPDGADRALYRKLHMFDVVVGGRDYRESDGEAPGDEVVSSTLADGTRVGLTICYDLRFPELYRALATPPHAARVLTVPSAFTEPTTRDHWEVLLRARAIEDQAFVIAANQVGRHAPGLKTGGRSMIVDPWGVVLATAPDTETYVIADLDLARQDRIRTDLPSLANRRPEVC